MNPDLVRKLVFFRSLKKNLLIGLCGLLSVGGIATVYANSPSQGPQDAAAFYKGYCENGWELVGDSSGNLDAGNDSHWKMGCSSGVDKKTNVSKFVYPECDWSKNQVRDVYYNEATTQYEYKNYHYQEGVCGYSKRSQQTPRPTYQPTTIPTYQQPQVNYYYPTPNVTQKTNVTVRNENQNTNRNTQQTYYYPQQVMMPYPVYYYPQISSTPQFQQQFHQQPTKKQIKKMSKNQTYFYPTYPTYYPQQQTVNRSSYYYSY